MPQSVDTVEFHSVRWCTLHGSLAHGGAKHCEWWAFKSGTQERLDYHPDCSFTDKLVET